MAISDFKVGGGQYALAYGEHVVAGILAGWDNSNTSAVKIKVLLGLGEWNQLKEVSYDGTIIDPANYTFHPGTASTGASDTVQGPDSRFPNSIYHNRIAYYTMTIPSGMGAEDRPDKMRVIAETLKVNTYNSSGVWQSYIYSTNPADVFADVVRRNSERLGLDFTSRMDWAAYAAARTRYATTISTDDRKRTPTGVVVSNVATGSLSSGVWYYKVVATGASGAISTPSDIVAVSSAASSKNNLSWTQVSDATGYRVYYSYNNPNTFNNYFDVSGGSTITFSHTTTSGASSGTPPTLPGGSWAVSVAEFQCHRAFTSSDILTGDALSAIMLDAASEWVMDGSKFRILLPNPTTISHTFNLTNTIAESFSFSKTPLRDRVNQITASFRNLDNQLKPEEQTPANDFTGQSRVGIVHADLPLGSMNTSQMRRITKWRLKDEYMKPRNATLVGTESSAHLLVGDLVNVVDRQAGVRDLYGGLANDGLIVHSHLLVSGSGSGTIRWGGGGIAPPKAHKSQPLKMTLSGAHGSSLLATVGLAANVTVSSTAELLTYVYIVPGFADPLVELGVIAVNSGGSSYAASYRIPGTSTAISATSVTFIKDIPPKGGWVPLRINLAAIGFSGQLSSVKFYTKGGDVTTYFSGVTYFDNSGRTYKVDEIEDRDSNSAGEREFKLKESYSSPYDVNDAVVTLI